MPVYVAMLRGINVGPHKRIKMEKLRASFEALGFTKVETYIQSGNVVFEAGKSSSGALPKKIEERLLGDFRFPVSVTLRTQEEMRKTLQANPFVQMKGIDELKLHVTFLSEAPAAPTLKELEKLTAAPDQSRCSGREIYLYLPNGVSRSNLVNNPVERRLLGGATMRNWRTVNALYEIAAGYK